MFLSFGSVGFDLVKGNSGKNGSKLAISVMFGTPMPRYRSPRLGIKLRQGGGSFA